MKSRYCVDCKHYFDVDRCKDCIDQYLAHLASGPGLAHAGSTDDGWGMEFEAKD